MLARLFSLGLAPILAIAACSAPADRAADEGETEDLLAAAVPGVDESALDRAVDPCTDFYAFACGGFIASQPPETKDEIRGFTRLQQDQLALFDRVIDELGRPGARKTPAERKAAAFLESCRAEPVPAATLAVVQGFRRTIESTATDARGIARAVALLQRRGIDPFFAVNATPDTARKGRHGSATFIPSGFDWFTDYESPLGHEERVAALARSIRAIEPELAESDAIALATAAARIEQPLALAGASLDPNEPLHPIGKAGLRGAAPHFAWDDFFDALGRRDPGTFTVAKLPFFAAIDGILQTADPADVRAYLVARWYEAAATELASAPSGEARAKYCRSELAGAMADAIEPRFLALAGVDARAQQKARALFRRLVDAFEAGLTESDSAFLDLPTRIEAEAKIAKLRAAIAKSSNLDDFTDVTIDARAPYFANALRLRERAFGVALANIGKALPLLHVDVPAPLVNATYDPALNKINVPGGILGGYFFAPTASGLANFAAIGTVLAHEITHGFDNVGRHLDGDGVVRDWWTPAVRDEFRTRAQCLVDQYGAFTLEGVTHPTSGETPARLSGRLTLGENIADDGGIKTAYRAAKVEGKDGPVVAGFAPAAQFFVGYAQLWCAKQTPEAAAAHLAEDTHAPPKARVNLPLANFPAFARAFQCKEGAPMAPANRCGVF